MRCPGSARRFRPSSRRCRCGFGCRCGRVMTSPKRAAWASHSWRNGAKPLVVNIVFPAGIGAGQRVQKRLGRHAHTGFGQQADRAHGPGFDLRQGRVRAIRLTPIPMTRCATRCPQPRCFPAVSPPACHHSAAHHSAISVQRPTAAPSGARRPRATPAPRQMTAAPPHRRVRSGASHRIA